MNSVWSVYALYSVNHNRIYIGMSKRVEMRLSEHNWGKVKSTKAFIPWIKIYEKEIGTREEAREYEKYLKTTSGRRIIRGIISSGKFFQ